MPSKLSFSLQTKKKNMLDCVYPCPGGYYGDSLKPCACAQGAVTKYQKRILGSLLDRVDIHIEVPRVDYEKLCGDRMGETSESICKRVQAACNILNDNALLVRSLTSLVTLIAHRGDTAILQVAG
jgi:predicted ATPase with chaperone activity